MWNLKRLGIILMMVGAFFPSVLYPFARPTITATILQFGLARKGFFYQPRLYDLEILIIKGIAIPYHYLLACGIIFFFIGLGLTALAYKKKGQD